MSGDGSKRYKGQLQVFPGGPSGEPVATTLYEVNSKGLIQYFGEAKFGATENGFHWHLVRFDYDGASNVQAVRTAVYSFRPGATTVTVDLNSNPGFVRVQLNSADLELLSPGDVLFVNTPSNKITGAYVKQILSPTEVLILPDGYVGEAGTSVGLADVYVQMQDKECQGFDKRRWDKRDLYLYA